MTSIYGNTVGLTNLYIQGFRTDSYADPGADLIAIVDFDPTDGCDQTSGFFTPGGRHFVVY